MQDFWVDPLQALMAFGFTLPRLLAIFAMIPVLSRQALPGMLRSGVALGFGLLVAPTLMEPLSVPDRGILLSVLVMAKEAMVGTVIGFVMAVPLWAFDAMGSFADTQRGANMAQQLNPLTGHESTPLGDLFSQAAVTYLVASGGLLLLLDATYRSYELWPVFDFWPRLNDQAPQVLLGQLDRLTMLAVLLGAPVLVAMLLAELGLALVSRFAPQLQVFFLAMPIKSALAMFIFAVYAVTLFEQGGEIINDMGGALDVVRSMLVERGPRAMSGEKTERPTDHRLREARKDGNVCKSKDLTQVLLLGALFGYTLVAADDIVRECVQLMQAPAAVHGVEFREALSIVTQQVLVSTLKLILPYALIVIVVGIFAETIQSGMLFAFKTLMPKGDKLNPVTNLKQMFSMKNFVELIKSTLKVVLLTVIVGMVIRDAIDVLVKVPAAGIVVVGQSLHDLMKTMLIYVFIACLLIAILDFAYQRYQYIKSLMMSMEEIKQEFKQLEGDPHVKNHRKELARELAMGEGAQKTAKASVVVTNPTHLAIALYYREDETALPIVLAKGEGAIAAYMVRIARAEGIPVMQNIPLARSLMRTARVDRYIPSELIEPVAEVLRAVRELREQGEDTP